MRLLVVDDEVRFADTLARGLRRRGFTVDVSHDGVDGLEKARLNEYDVIVLDRDLPGLHGDEVCRRLVAGESPSRILMLTASSTIDDLVDGLGLGADDYLGKPFDFSELVARVQAVARRRGTAQPPQFTVRDLTIDTGRHLARRGGRELALTAREFGVLVELVRAAGATVSAETLLERVWDENADPFTTSVRVIMSRLRSKLGDPPLIDTVVGVGYRITP
jgi:DNA-binding response OmpR family regulator